MKRNSNSKMVSWVRGKCIGRGTFGTVNMAINRLDGGVFAMKSVDRDACHPTQIDSLENEIRILRSLSSPYVVKYLGDDVSYESPTTSCRNLHLEYLPGGTVADLATDVDENVLRSHVYCVVSALRYLHSRGIVHCDIKGRNILVGHSSGSCKVADFGSAKEISGEERPLLPRGSPLWMAPEVVRGDRQGPESDVWSLGCTVIEMVSGKPAWEDFGADTLRRIGFSTELPSFPTRLSELGRDFIEKCLRREPSERWSCDQLLRHPFLLYASPKSNNTITESSPRCVLDWVNSEFEEDEEEDEDSDFENFEVSAKERIGKLATSKGAIWESNGWVAVRGHEEEQEEGEGTRREYSNSASTEAEAQIEGTSSEYLDSVRIEEEITIRVNSELKNMDGFAPCCSGCGGCPSCHHGSKKVELAVKAREMGNYIYEICNFLLFCVYCVRIFRYNLLMFLYGIFYILYFFFFSYPNFICVIWISIFYLYYICIQNSCFIYIYLNFQVLYIFI